MNYILFDDHSRDDLLPLTYLRPVADIRIGILTIREKWEKLLNVKTSSLTEDYLSEKFPTVRGDRNILLNGSVCPNTELVEDIKKLKPNQALVKDDVIIALNMKDEDLDGAEAMDVEDIEDVLTKADIVKLGHPWDIFRLNGRAIKSDFELLTKGRKSLKLSDTNSVIGEENIFVEEGAVVEMANLNATTGPIYIGKNAVIMENSTIRGPFALCEGSTVKMSAKIYGPTTLGPHSKLGGEVNNSVIFGYSNKAHDGFLGNSVIAEWCNIGADTNNSNLKNSYDNVKLWSYTQETFIDTGLQFCGLIMGDHSKTGINTMFNTGTVVGVNVNVFGSGFQRNFIPSFSWGGTKGFKTYNIIKALDVAKAVFARRDIEFDDVEKKVLTDIYEITRSNRKS